jgi:hypothetical protein
VFEKKGTLVGEVRKGAVTGKRNGATQGRARVREGSAIGPDSDGENY